MITEQFLTHLTATQRATLELLLARDEGCEVSRGEFAELPELLDLEHVGLLGWDVHGGEYLTAKGRALVVNLAHADAVREDTGRAAARHALPDGAESTLPGLGVVVVHRLMAQHELTEVLPAVSPQGFVDSMPEALEGHTADLLDLVSAINAAQRSWPHRVGRWFARNLTGTRVTILAGTVGVLVGTGIGWWVR
ncbi:hypothetical protein [Amycolatopsis sp. CFH S0078]|uniref:hypothetical protein n=1 Tax=Amycolatopsis sp. CFH S0078 TaxID=1644108 RepID=UPI00106DFCEA|nr:hypothetical protein [Amycolatopsis sp. CFH S0078]